MLETLTIAAVGRLSRWGRKGLTMLTTPQKLTFITRSMSEVSSSAKGTNLWMMPATLSRPSTLPWASITACGGTPPPVAGGVAPCLGARVAPPGMGQVVLGGGERFAVGARQ